MKGKNSNYGFSIETNPCIPVFTFYFFTHDNETDIKTKVNKFQFIVPEEQ